MLTICTIEVDVSHHKDDGYPMPTVDILSAKEVRYFWVTWDDMTIAVGDGKIPKEPETERHSYTGLELRGVNAIALSTVNSVGNWEWDVNQGW